MTLYTEGVCEDGAAILKDGQPLTVSEILTALNENERLRDLLQAAKIACPHGERLLHGANVSIAADAYRALCAAIAEAEGDTRGQGSDLVKNFYAWNERNKHLGKPPYCPE